eukprot:14937671-Alexandrium_andersonii.AAC.1
MNVVRIRGADVAVVGALESFYRQHAKYFKLDGSFGSAYRAANGIAQGCPLSRMVLDSITAS